MNKHKPHWTLELYNVEVFLAEVTKIRVPEDGMSFFLGDTDYYNPVRPEMQAPLAFRAKHSTGIS